MVSQSFGGYLENAGNGAIEGFLDQTYFVLGLVHDQLEQVTERLALKAVRDGEGWKIQAKQVNLIDCDQSIRNPSIIL